MNEHQNKQHHEVVDGEHRLYSGEDKEVYFHEGWTWDAERDEWYKVIIAYA